MGRGSYLGGSTIIRPGSSWFSRSKKKKKADGPQPHSEKREKPKVSKSPKRRTKYLSKKEKLALQLLEQNRKIHKSEESRKERIQKGEGKKRLDMLKSDPQNLENLRQRQERLKLEHRGIIVEKKNSGVGKRILTSD